MALKEQEKAKSKVVFGGEAIAPEIQWYDVPAGPYLSPAFGTGTVTTGTDVPYDNPITWSGSFDELMIRLESDFPTDDLDL